MKRYRVVKEKLYRKKVFDKSFLHQNFSYFCNNFLLKKYDLRQEIACHKVLIKSNNFSDDTDESVYSIISVVRNRAQIQEAITICLEEPIHRMLEKLFERSQNCRFKQNTEIRNYCWNRGYSQTDDNREQQRHSCCSCFTKRRNRIRYPRKYKSLPFRVILYLIYFLKQIHKFSLNIHLYKS